MLNRHPYEDLTVVLVSGQARSGTTVLTKALGQHPQIVSTLKESNYVADVVRLVHSNLTKPHVVSELVVAEQDFVLAFRRALLNVLFPQPDTKLAGVKAVSTFSSLQLDMADGMKLLFPNLMIANVVRNGIEVVASRIGHEHIGKLSFQQHCTAWAHAIDMARWGEKHSEFLLIRHEEILDDESVRKVFAALQIRLGVSHSDECAKFVIENQINSEFQSEGTADRKRELENRKQRWGAWTADQRDMFEDICQPAMDYFEYPIPWQN